MAKNDSQVRNKPAVPPSNVPKQPGFYKIVTGIKGLPSWVQYYDGRAWHGPVPPVGAKFLEMDEPEVEDEEEIDGDEDARVEIPNIQVREFKCGTCGSAEIGQRSIVEKGVATYEIFCPNCERIEEESRLYHPKLPLTHSGAVVLDSEGLEVAKIACFPKDEKSNVELARLFAAALNAWNEMAELVDANPAAAPCCTFHSRVASHVREFRSHALETSQAD